MAETEEKPKSKKGFVIILLVILLILVAGGVGAFFLLNKDSKEDRAKEEAQKAEEAIMQVTVPPFLVNLADPLGRRFIKLSMNVEVANPEIAAMIEKKMFQIRDKIILLLSSKTYSDLAALDSKLYLKNEIVERINQVISPHTVNQVYFTDMIIQ